MRALRWLYKIPLKIRSIFHRNDLEKELAEELQFHLESKIDQLIAAGFSKEEAGRAALREMDGLEQQKELCRDSRGVGLVEDFVKDLRYGVRTLSRTPILVGVVVISLALGIGANAAIFSVMNAVLLNSPPVEGPDQLLLLDWSSVNSPDKYLERVEGTDYQLDGRHHS